MTATAGYGEDGHPDIINHINVTVDGLLRWPDGTPLPICAEMSPCISTEVAVLGVVGDPVRLRCGGLDGHSGPHRFVMEWTDA